MKNEILFTISQFAKMHNINKRTLHYYDQMKLFSPAVKKENNYRYYTLTQCAELEYILALKEVGMSLAEIKEYLTCPNSDNLIKVTNKKIEELDSKLNYFMNLKTYLKRENELLMLTKSIKDGDILLKKLEKETLYCTPIIHGTTDIRNMKIIMEHLHFAWNFTPFKVGCGSYIDLEKIKKHNFEQYDGLFSILKTRKTGKNIITRSQGTYLCGYNIGSWNKIPKLYEKMLDYAKKNNLTLIGNAYELGINGLSNLTSENYVTEIIIQCQDF